MGNVLAIGGAPMIGKSTIAIELASRLKVACISTDDIGEALRALPSSYNPMDGLDYREYYIHKSLNDLILDAQKQHQSYWKSIKAVIDAHLKWGKSTIIEGWNLYPKLLETNNPKLKSLWLVSNYDLLSDRFTQNKDFHGGSSDFEVFRDNYIGRSMWYNDKIHQEASENGRIIIEVDNSSTVDSIVDEILDRVGSW